MMRRRLAASQRSELLSMWRSLLSVLIFTVCVVEGQKRGKEVVIDRVVAFPEPHSSDTVLLRNQGGRAVDMRGWWLTDARKSKTDSEAVLLLGKGRGCDSYSGIPAGGVLELTPRTKSNPCGIPFGVSNTDALYLMDEADEEVASLEWNWALPGLSLRRNEEGSHDYFPENKPIGQLMQDDIPELSLFVQALQGTDLWEMLWRDSGNREPSFSFSANELIPFQLPSGFDLAMKEQTMAKFKSEAPSNTSIFPYPGKLTVLGPSDAAMEAFYESDVFGQGLSPEEIRNRPEFREILQLHLLPGYWTTGYFLDDTQLQTALSGARLTVIHKAKQRTIRFGMGCGEAQRAKWGCPCDSPCAAIQRPDLYAPNGVIHVVDQILLPEGLLLAKEANKERSKTRA